MRQGTYRKPKGLFPAAAAWIVEPSEVVPAACGHTGTMQSARMPRRANLYSKSSEQALSASRVGSKCVSKVHPHSMQIFDPTASTQRNLRRWQPGYQVSPRTALTRSPRAVSRNIIQISTPIDDLRYRRPLRFGPWDGLVRRQELSVKEDVILSENPVCKSETTAMHLSDVHENEAEFHSGSIPITEKGRKTEADMSPPEPEAQLQHDKEVARMSVFKRLQNDGELDKGELFEALRLLNFPRPKQTWVNEILATLTRFSCLNSAEFLSFVSLYDERQKRAYEDEFHRFDEDNSGEVDAGELATLLEGLGVTPLPGILEENIKEVDFDGTGKLNVEEFIEILELQWQREGFSKSEVDEFQKAFRKFDRDDSGEVSSAELLGILAWLGYPERPDVLQNVIKRSDGDGTGELCWTEMLSCMRLLREAEVEHVKELLAKYDADNSGEVDYQELVPLLDELGYTASAEAIKDAVEDAHLGSDDDAFDFNELWRLLHVYRRRAGFTREEDADLIAAHSRYDHKQEGHISTLELGKALRLLGYSVPVEMQKKLLQQVDVDGSGRIDVAEFRTLMRMQKEIEHEEMIEVFRYYAGDQDKLSPADVPRALRRVGCIQANGSVPVPNTQVGELNFDDFTKLVVANFKAARERMRLNAGFTSSEVAEFRTMFQDFDEDGTGDIAGAELRKLMRCIFPDVALSSADRRLMEQILNDVDQDGSGSLDFADFLRLMRHYHDEQSRKQLENMWEGFSEDEARQFKTIFESEDVKQAGYLPPNQIVSMIQRIVPLGAVHLGQLSQLLSEVRNGTPNVDFPGFLRVMRHVLDVDLGGINGHAAAQCHASSES
eukprot:gnl/MRDRNA2_/MRDRNA2_65478_c0_seq1.p1 gnl/MRDRNA2_/MRDRNA2_65478_c0~~gnl/MRDRNA2_/MRDRNA2_65478_c0_seq1.p1  ORF type:complete len:835 (-),score=178.73 gnl/MRDRNA2_/MRDRNA2_65478_c0_seq1:149-2653(-)